jgi:CheY-like chemotaxis protein
MSRETGEALTPTRVLIVDDDRVGSAALADLLEEDGYEVARAANGREALDRLNDRGPLPSVILLDLWMPVMNGWSFREAQQRDRRLADIPVVVITATAPGPDDPMSELPILSKPLDIPLLLEIVARHCGRANEVS